MPRHWTPELETGNSDIDHHHRELFQLTSMLDQAVRSQRTDALERVIVFLEHYVVDHFSDEESVMKLAHYAFYSHHRAEHDVFRVQVAGLRAIFDEGFSAAHISFAIRRLLDKLLIHVRTVDIGIASIVRLDHDQKPT
ncbi:hypothetical protein EB093_07740 [bacterium]|nr:hypothetical protein [bacterium]